MRKRPLGAASYIAATPVPLRSPVRRRFYVPPAMRAVHRALGIVAIQPLGPVPMREIDFLEEIVASLLGARSVSLPPIAIPTDYLDRVRQQYDADRLLDLLFAHLPDSAIRIVGVLDADMFAAGRTFVFGYAHLRDGIGLYSLARLREEWYRRPTDESLLHARAFRAVAHEIGHTFGNPHCTNPACVMQAVSHIDSLDSLGPSYCANCMRRVRRGLTIAPTSAEGLFERGGALFRRNCLGRAVDVYREAIGKAPLEARYHNDLGVALLATADRDSAREAFARAAELSSDFPHPYYNLGILCHEEGAVEVAESYFGEGLARDRDPVSAHRYLAKLYDELFGDLERARRHYGAYLDLGGDEVSIVSRAWALGARRYKSQFAGEPH